MLSLELRASQVEVPVAKAKLLGGKRLAAVPRDGDHRRLRRTDEAQCLPAHLDLAGRELGVPHLGGPRDDVTRDEHDALGRQRRARSSSVCGDAYVRIERDLHDARAIAKIDEHETTEVAACDGPIPRGARSSDVLEAERATQRVAERGLER